MTNKVIELLKKYAPADDVAEVHTFRLTVDGVDMRCELFDHGDSAGDNRFSVRASRWDTPNNGQKFNAEPTEEVAIANIRWAQVK